MIKFHFVDTLESASTDLCLCGRNERNTRELHARCIRDRVLIRSQWCIEHRAVCHWTVLSRRGINAARPASYVIHCDFHFVNCFSLTVKLPRNNGSYVKTPDDEGGTSSGICSEQQNSASGNEKLYDNLKWRELRSLCTDGREFGFFEACREARIFFSSLRKLFFINKSTTTMTIKILWN